MKQWSIRQMNREKDSGLVVSVIWEISQAGAKEVLTGASHFARSDSFIPFEQLTEDVVLGWVKDELGAAGVEAFERAHDDQIARQAAVVAVPEIEAGLPWQKQEAE